MITCLIQKPIKLFFFFCFVSLESVGGGAREYRDHFLKKKKILSTDPLAHKTLRTHFKITKNSKNYFYFIFYFFSQNWKRKLIVIFLKSKIEIKKKKLDNPNCMYANLELLFLEFQFIFWLSDRIKGFLAFSWYLSWKSCSLGKDLAFANFRIW